MAQLVKSPYPVFLDIDGTPVDEGYLFIGEPDLDPETNPKQAYWDEALTDPANNIRTQSGYPVNGTYPARIYIDGEYSIKVKNKRDRIVYAVQNSEAQAGGDVEEAPIDGKQYGREDAGWTEITGGGGAVDAIGTIKTFSHQEARTGLLEFALDNAVSQGTYAPLFAKIGHKYNDLHVLAGDTDLSGSGTLFYPTPPPSEEWELVYEDDPGTLLTVPTSSLSKSGIARYSVVLGNNGSGVGRYTSNLTLDDLNQDIKGTQGYNDSATKFNVLWDASASSFASQYASAPIVRIYRESEPEAVSVDGAYKYIKAESITPSGEQISSLRYNTGWVANSDWTGNQLPVNHDLGADLSDLLVKFFISTDGTEANAFEPKFAVNEDSTADTGFTYFQTDSNNIFVQTAVTGLRYVIAPTGGTFMIDNEAYYYKVVVTKPNLITTTFDQVNRVYDISDSTDVTYNLPDANSVVGDITVKRRGSGTGKVLFATVDSQTIEGLASSIWELEGEGTIVVTSYAGNWEVKEYNDYLTIADSGVFTDRIVEKYASGRMVASGVATPATNNNSGTTTPFGVTFIIVPKVVAHVEQISSSGTSSSAVTETGARTTTSVNLKALSHSGSSVSDVTSKGISYIVDGRWRA